MDIFLPLGQYLVTSDYFYQWISDSFTQPIHLKHCLNQEQNKWVSYISHWIIHSTDLFANPNWPQELDLQAIWPIKTQILSPLLSAILPDSYGWSP